jgi:two-component system response regulator FlrC
VAAATASKRLDPSSAGSTMALLMEPKVLFIDDDPEWRKAASLALEGAGYGVITAKDASEAMEKGEGSKLGLIVLDLNLAGESGLTLMKYLRHNYPGVPILLFTGMEHDDSTVRAMLDEGADQYMRKSGVEELVVTVGAYLRPS